MIGCAGRVVAAVCSLLVGCAARKIEPAPSCSPYPKELLGRFDCQGPSPASTAALAAVNPEAWGNWDGMRCSYGELNRLALPLPDCFGDASLSAQFFAAVAPHDVVFGISAAEHVLETRPPGLNCDDIIAQVEAATTAGAARMFADLRRVAYGGTRFRAYAGVAELSVDGGAVVLDNIRFIENLTSSAELAAELAACPVADEAALAELLLAGSYAYQEQINFRGWWCSGEWVARTYVAAPGDRIIWLDDGAAWTDNSVVLRQVRDARLIIDRAHWPSGSHDLRCKDDEQEWLGFDLTVDAVTGEVLHAKAGGPCITC